MTTKYEPGRYMFRVTNQGFGESKDKHTPYFFLEGTPVYTWTEEGIQEPVEGYTRTLVFYITDKTVDRVTGDLQKLGWEGSKWGELDPSNPRFHSFIDTEIEVECKHEFRNDDTFERWQLPYEGREAAQSDPKVASKLDAMFGRNLADRSRPKPATSSKQTAKPAMAGANANRSQNEDIPF